MQDKFVLITDSFSKHAIALSKYILKYDKKINLAGHSITNIKEKLYYNTVFKGDLKGVLNKYDNKISLVIPVWAESVYHLVKIGYKKSIHINDINKLNMCFDKYQTFKFLKKINIDVPKTYTLKNFKKHDFFKKNTELVLKHRNELIKGKVEYLNENNFDFYDDDNDKIIQEKVNGVGMGFFAFYDNGKLIKYYMHERIREIPHTGGSSVAAKSIYNKNIFNLGKKILDKLNWNGVAMVEFKYDKINNKYYVIEINPKFWGSLELGLSSGINFGELIIKKFEGKEMFYKPSENIYKKIKFYWPLDGDIISIIKSKKLYNFLTYFLFDYKTNINYKILKFKFYKLINYFR